MEQIIFLAFGGASVVAFGGWFWVHEHKKNLHSCARCGRIIDECTCEDEHWFIG